MTEEAGSFATCRQPPQRNAYKIDIAKSPRFACELAIIKVQQSIKLDQL